MANTAVIPVLVIQFLDLDNTTSNVADLEKLLEQAANKNITLIPVIMEFINSIYWRDKTICLDPDAWRKETGTYNGTYYQGETDDKRAINTFIGKTFAFIQNILPGRSKIIVRYTDTYEEEAKKLLSLIQGQKLQSELILTKEF